jgi:transcription initiation factor IIE alpha subunit
MTVDERTLQRIPRYTGKDKEAQTELDHFGNCPHCGALVDMRDLKQVIQHVHDRWEEITNSNGPLM